MQFWTSVYTVDLDETGSTGFFWIINQGIYLKLIRQLQLSERKVILCLLFAVFRDCVDYIMQAGKGEAQWLDHLNEGK